jgi:hypothetical protein
MDGLSKKLSKDVFDGFADDVKDIKQELQHMYCPHMSGHCDMITPPSIEHCVGLTSEELFPMSYTEIYEQNI